MIDQLELMRILVRVRGDAVVMPVFRANGAWSQVSNNPIRDVPIGTLEFPAVMGIGSSFALGLSLARPELAWTCCDYAGLLLDPESKADRSKALTLLDESYSIATDLGMRPLMERVNLRIEQVQAQSVTATEFPGGLTHREVEVLRLIAGGKTNSEISEELVIAEGTARRHVANIYEKIGAANRAEATRYALRGGLLALDEDQSSSP